MRVRSGYVKMRRTAQGKVDLQQEILQQSQTVQRQGRELCEGDDSFRNSKELQALPQASSNF